MGKRLSLIALAAVVLVASESASAALGFVGGEEVRSLTLLNATRATRALSGLAQHAGLDAIARAQAVRMAERGEIYHNPRLGTDADAAGISWTRLGENVGVGPNVAVIHDAFLASPRHHDNMLFGPYNAVGVGVVAGTGARSGQVFVAHVFGRLTPAVSIGSPKVTAPTAAPRPVLPTIAPAAARASTPRPSPSRPAATAEPNALVGGLVDQTALIGIALPA